MTQRVVPLSFSAKGMVTIEHLFNSSPFKNTQHLLNIMIAGNQTIFSQSALGAPHQVVPRLIDPKLALMHRNPLPGRPKTCISGGTGSGF